MKKKDPKPKKSWKMWALFTKLNYLCPGTLALTKHECIDLSECCGGERIEKLLTDNFQLKRVTVTEGWK